VSQYQKGKTNLDFTEARDSEWQWQRLGHMQVSTSLLSTADMVVQRRDGPRRLREIDDDDVATVR